MLCLAACKPSEERPRNLIPEDKMAEVMADVHIFEAMKTETKMTGDSLWRFVKVNYEQIFEKHDISAEQYNRTFNYYEHNPGKMDELMTKVIDELSRREASLKEKKEEMPADSSKGRKPKKEKHE